MNILKWFTPGSFGVVSEEKLVEYYKFKRKELWSPQLHFDLELNTSAEIAQNMSILPCSNKTLEWFFSRW